VVWAHLGRKRGEAMIHAATTLDLFDGFSYIIREDFCFDKFDMRAILRPRQRKDSPLEWEQLVQADFQFQERFTLKHETPKLKQISLRVRDGLADRFNLVK
jgi:hypothetical protein